MNQVTQLPTLVQIEEEAAAWVWRLDAEQLSAADHRAFESWLRRDPRHKRAFEELGGVWQSLDALAEAKRDEKIATFTTPKAAAPVRQQRRRFPLAIAAALASVVAVGWWWANDGTEAQVLSTAVGQKLTATLADGSTVILNTNSIIETSFVEDRREVRLRKGEAHFTVARDAQRPFRVYAGNAVVQALGTAFNVRLRDPRSVQVLVTEGWVKVVDHRDPKSQSGSTERSLGAGQKVETGDADLAVADVSNKALTKALAWRDGAVVLDGSPLAEAVVEINRYAEIRFVVTDPNVAALRVGGRFRTGDVEEFLRALETALPVTTRRTGDGLVYIDPRAVAEKSP